MQSGKILSGILAGFAAGAILGMLYAPDKGSATRRKISDKSDEYSEELKARYEELVNMFRSKYGEAKKSAMDIADEGKETLAYVKDEANYLAREAKKAAKHAYNA
jgi:gas vesicle protein